MIIVRAPFRTSFVGGGTDLPSHFKVFGGAALSMSINRHVYLTGRRMFYPTQTLLKYSQSELVSNINEIRHPIFRAALKWFCISGLDIGVTSDIPAGTGLGSSSTFSVALIALLSQMKNENLSKHEIAEMACELEIDRLGETIGKQDQYASAFGGLNFFTFHPDGRVDVLPVNLTVEDINWLNEACWLVKLPGESRSASTVLAETQKFVSANPDAKASLRELGILAEKAHKSVQQNGVQSLPDFVKEAWDLKKRSNPHGSTEIANEFITRGLASGAIAGKMLGAGGGGFAFFFVEPKRKLQFLNEFSTAKVLNIRPEFNGVTTLLKEEEE